MKSYRFPCGCSWPILQESSDPDVLPLLDFDVEAAPENCVATWAMLGEGRSKGVFQLETQLGKSWCKKLKPQTGEHMSALGAILRPGCLKAVDDEGVSATQHYCRRKNHEEPTLGYHPVVDAILFPTYNVMVYQEQAMAIAQAVAGFSLQEADILRKAIGKKLPEEMAKVKKLFIEGVARCGIVTVAQGEELFDWIEKSQRYSFNHSHALCYGLTGYDTAYIKAHFPVAFFTAWLYYAKDKQDPLQEVFELVNDAKLFNIDVEPPDFRGLQTHFHTDRKVVRFGLSDIKGVGPAQVKKMAESVERTTALLGNRAPADWTWFEFLLFCSSGLSSTVVTHLIQVGALRWFNLPRQRMLAEYNAWSALTETEQEWIVEAVCVQRGDFVRTELEALKTNLEADPPQAAIDAGWGTPEEQDALKAKLAKTKLRIKLMDIFQQGRQDLSSLEDALSAAAKRKSLPKPKKGEPPINPGDLGAAATADRVSKMQGHLSLLRNPPTPLMDAPVWLAYIEEELLGIPITCSKVDSCDLSAVNVTCKDYLGGQSGFLIFGVEVQCVREVKTKKGKTPGSKMAFLTLIDHSCSLEDVVCFPETWKEFGHLLTEGNTVILQGERSDKKDSNTLMVKKVWQASQTGSAAA